MKQVILLLLAITTTIFCSAQEKRELKWQDFLNSVKTTEIAKPVKTGEFTIFQISDINKFLYRVEIEGRVFELQTPIPTELQNLFRLTPEQLQQRAGENKVKEGADKAAKETGNMKKLTGDLKAGGGNSEKVLELNNSMKKLIQLCEQYYEEADKLAQHVFDLKHTRNKLVLVAQSDRPFNKIQTMLSDVPLPESDNIKSIFANVRRLYHKVEAAYNDASKKADETKEDGDELPAVVTNALEKIKDAKEGIEEADELIEDEALLALLDEVDFLYKELGNKNNFTVLSPPVQMDGDMISYNVIITPTQTRTAGPYKNPMQFKFDIPAKRGLKVDFGIGPAFSFGENSRNDRYYLKEDYNNPLPSSPDSIRLLKLNNNNTISPGLAAMMHAYSRNGKWGGLGLAFGVGAGFQGSQDVNFSIYTGACVVLGKREKIMLSSGVSWLSVERIKGDQFKNEAVYDKTKINLGDVTEKAYKGSFFLCITYSLTNKVEIK